MTLTVTPQAFSSWVDNCWMLCVFTRLWPLQSSLPLSLDIGVISQDSRTINSLIEEWAINIVS